MKRTEFRPLLHTTAVQLALRYALLYALLLGLSLGAVLWVENWQLDSEPDRRLEEDLRVLVQQYQRNGEAGLIGNLAQRGPAPGAERRMVLFVAANGGKRAGNLLAWPDDADFRYDGRASHDWIGQELIPRDIYDDDAYVAAVAWKFAGGSRLLLARRDSEAEEALHVREYLTEVLSVAVLLGLVMALTLGRGILRRMDTISRTAGEIMAGDLSKRVPVSARGDEFDALAQRLNAMLDRIQQLIRGMREVTDNVAHDLRSPLTRLRNRLEVTLLEPRGGPEYRQVIVQGIEDADGLIKTFNALLGIAQAEAGSLRTRWETVELSALACDLGELYIALAEEKGQTLDIVTDVRAEIDGSRDLLAQALGNLLDNAIKYTPEGGAIQVRIATGADGVEISVADNGPGIAESERSRVLERFVRLESSRRTPGNGLGLALVAAVAYLHQAALTLGDGAPGLIVTLRFLPQAPR